MNPPLRGRAWVFGDDINTDLIFPAEVLGMTPDERVEHIFSANRPGFSSMIAPGDLLVAGRNFGTGSGRPAAQVLKMSGLGGLIAEGFNGLFFRSCVNYALPALTVPGISTAVTETDELEVSFDDAVVTNRTTGAVLRGKAWPEMLRSVLERGGIISALREDGLLLDGQPPRGVKVRSPLRHG